MQETTLPTPNLDTKEFWEGCNRHELLIQRCKECGTWRHYPRPLCHNCTSFETEWVRVSGRGQVYSYIIAYHSFHPAFAPRVPYAVVLVELEDAPVRLASNLVYCPLEEISIGIPVEVVFEEVKEATLYKFRPRAE